MTLLWILVIKLLAIQLITSVVNAQWEIDVGEFANDNEIPTTVPVSVFTITSIPPPKTVFITVTETVLEIDKTVPGYVESPSLASSLITLTTTSIHEQVSPSTRKATSTSTVVITRLITNVVTETATLEDIYEETLAQTSSTPEIVFDLEPLPHWTNTVTKEKQLEKPNEITTFVITATTTSYSDMTLDADSQLTTLQPSLEVVSETSKITPTVETTITMSPEELLEVLKPYHNLPVVDTLISEANAGPRTFSMVFCGGIIGILISVLIT